MGLRRFLGRDRPGDEPIDESDDSQVDDLVETEDDVEDGAESDGAGSDDRARWERLDEQEWREDGPYDITEVDPDLLDEADPMRIDLGSLVLTGFQGMELRLQVAGETQTVVSVLMVKDDSALEVAAFSAPRSGGLWTEIRGDIIEATAEAGGTVAHAKGPFGTELRRLLPMVTPEGEQAYQPSRMWMAEGPRWCLRGVLYGQAAVTEGLDGPVTQLLETFRTIVVRRGDQPMAPGELLAIDMPEGIPSAAG